jgi:uncharacterized membrane protein YvbJ
MSFCPKCGQRFVDAVDGASQQYDNFSNTNKTEIKGKHEAPSQNFDYRAPDSSIISFN